MLAYEPISKPFTTIREHQRSYPVDVEKLAKSFGIVVIQKDWPETFVGAIGKDATGYFIIVNQNISMIRQRFTVAHEIGHYVLHKNQIGPTGIKDDWMYRSALNIAEEAAATKLALAILLPINLMGLAAIDKGLRLTPKDLPALAEALGVSDTAMAKRLGLPV